MAGGIGGTLRTYVDNSLIGTLAHQLDAPAPTHHYVNHPAFAMRPDAVDDGSLFGEHIPAYPSSTFHRLQEGRACSLATRHAAMVANRSSNILKKFKRRRNGPYTKEQGGLTSASTVSLSLSFMLAGFTSPPTITLPTICCYAI